MSNFAPNLSTGPCLYCNGMAKMGPEDMLQCGLCHNIAHISCLKSGMPDGRLLGDNFFNFICSGCHQGNQDYSFRAKLSIPQLLLLVLYNLHMTEAQSAQSGFFHWEMHIFKYINQHWKEIFGYEWHTEEEEILQTSLSGQLSHYGPYFESGSKALQDGGWHKLRMVLPPAQLINQFTAEESKEPTTMDINEEFEEVSIEKEEVGEEESCSFGDIALNSISHDDSSQGVCIVEKERQEGNVECKSDKVVMKKENDNELQDEIDVEFTNIDANDDPLHVKTNGPSSSKSALFNKSTGIDPLSTDTNDSSRSKSGKKMNVVHRRRIQQRVHRVTGHADRPEIISQRGAIIGMRDAGMTQAAIALAMGLNVKTVTKWIRRSDGEGNVITRPRSGRPRIITAEDDQRIVQTVMERPLSSTVDITQELGLPCHPETTRRHLNECGLRCSIPAKKEKLTHSNKESRLEFARHYAQDVYDQNFWNSVIWTDEKSFQTTAAKSHVCWRPLNTTYAAPNIQELKKSERCSVSFHGWMWSGGLGDLTRIDCNLNSVKYIQILETIIPSIRATAIPAPNPIRFVHDRSPIHMSRLVREWFLEHPDIVVIDWPSKGCDVNVIENVWAMMVRTWDTQDEQNQATIVNHAIAEWENLRRLPNYCQRLVESVPERLNTIIEANGGWGKY